MWARRTRRGARVSSTVNFPAICLRVLNRTTSSSKFPSFNAPLNPPHQQFHEILALQKSKRKTPAKNSGIFDCFLENPPIFPVKKFFKND
jgi:hypothetical protein